MSIIHINIIMQIIVDFSHLMNLSTLVLKKKAIHFDISINGIYDIIKIKFLMLLPVYEEFKGDHGSSIQSVYLR